MPQQPPRRLPEGVSPGLEPALETAPMSERLAIPIWIAIIAAGLLWALLG